MFLFVNTICSSREIASSSRLRQDSSQRQASLYPHIHLSLREAVQKCHSDPSLRSGSESRCREDSSVAEFTLSNAEGLLQQKKYFRTASKQSLPISTNTVRYLGIIISLPHHFDNFVNVSDKISLLRTLNSMGGGLC